MNCRSEKMRINKLLVLRMWVVVLFLWTSISLSAQGWENIYGNPNYTDYGEAILQTDQTGYLVAGSSEGLSQDLDFDAVVWRTDPDGEIIWEMAFDAGFKGFGTDLAKAHEEDVYVLAGFNMADQLSTFDMHLLFFNERGEALNNLFYGSEDMDEFAYAIIPTTDGGYLLAGRQEDQAMAVKVDGTGNTSWSMTYPQNENSRFIDMVELSDGYVFLGRTQTTDTTYNFLLKTDYNGDEVWLATYSLGYSFNDPQALIQTSDGQLAFTGYAIQPFVDNPAYVVKVSVDGQQILWQSFITSYSEAQGHDLTELEDGSLVITGFAQITPADGDLLLAKYTADGNLLWQKNIGAPGNDNEIGTAITKTFDGGYALAGRYSSYLGLAPSDLYLVKSDTDGNTLNSYLQGKVFEDLNLDCSFDANEPLLKKWMVKAVGNNETFYGYTDENGFYSLLVDSGMYQLSIVPPAPYWDGCDGMQYDVQISYYDTLLQDFGVTKIISCPWLETDITTAFVQACDTIEYAISYRNRGTEIAQGAFLDIILDPKLNFLNADLPLTLQTDSLYRFELGNLLPDTEGNFTLRAFASCELIEEQAVISSAHIQPDSICLPPQVGWDGSRITVNAWCQDGTNYFSIKNIGPGDMAAPMGFIVIEDEIMGYQDNNFQLPAQDSILITRTSETGATFRLIAEQTPELPGYSRPNAVLEGCTDAGGSFSTGKVLQFPENEFDPFLSKDAQEVVFSLSANSFQTAFPKGYRGDTIAANTDIEYLLVFYNGTDEVVNRVYIRDTISDKLDFTSIEVGAASHPYTYEAYERGILKFKFNDIALQPGKYGFVKFHIKQQPDLPQGTEIFNRARLSIGYEGPELTAQKRHVIGGSNYQDFVEISVSVFSPLNTAQLNIYPNPSKGEVIVEVLGEENLSGWHCQVFDTQGRKLANYPFQMNSSILQLDKLHLPQGNYIIIVKNAMGKLMGIGKLNIQKP